MSKKKSDPKISVGVRIPVRLIKLCKAVESDKSFSQIVREALEEKYSFHNLKTRGVSFDSLSLGDRIILLEEEINKLMEEVE